MVACLCLLLSFQAYSQSDDVRTLLEQRIIETNKVLPVSAMQGLVFKEMFVADYSVCEVYEVDERYISFASLKRKKGMMKKTLLKRYREDSTLKSWAKMAVECNMDIVIRYVSKQSKDSFETVLKTKDLAKCLY